MALPTLLYVGYLQKRLEMTIQSGELQITAGIGAGVIGVKGSAFARLFLVLALDGSLTAI